jgi:hypothetical protein
LKLISAAAQARAILLAYTPQPGFNGPMFAPRQTKITSGEMRASGVTGILVYCADFKCSHMVPIAAPEWPDEVRLSDIENQFTSKACGKRGADVRPDFPQAKMGKTQ